MPGWGLNHTANRPNLVNIGHARIVNIHGLRAIQHSLRFGLAAHYLRCYALPQPAQKVGRHAAVQQ